MVLFMQLPMYYIFSALDFMLLSTTVWISNAFSKLGGAHHIAVRGESQQGLGHRLAIRSQTRRDR